MSNSIFIKDDVKHYKKKIFVFNYRPLIYVDNKVNNMKFKNR